MKEISKYLQKFIHTTFRPDKYELSPEAASFFNDLYLEIETADLQWAKQRVSMEPIDFSRNHEWKQGEHYSYLEPNVKTHLERANKMGIKCVFDHYTVYVVYPLSQYASHAISKKKQTQYYRSILRKVYLWVSMANKYRSKECSKHLTIYLFLTHLPKLLKRNEPVLGRSEVNTGFTMSCSTKNEIYVFREEEWFKVFIHEVFHAFGIDFSDSRLTPTQELCESRIQSIFKLPHIHIRVFETFAEICAEVIHLAFLQYFTNTRSLSYWLTTEMEFSAFQCAKIIDHSSMEYSDLYSQSPDAIQKRREYRENSNVFSYYVLKSILWNHFDAFMEWLIQSNGGSFKFLTNSHNVNAFCSLIEHNYNRPEYVAKINRYSNWLQTHRRENTIETKTLRMTVYE